VKSIIISVASLLIAAPSIAEPFIRFNSVGMNENDRGYEFSAGNSNLEVGVVFDTTGQTSAIVLTRMSF
jgi:hypothetical protein